MSARGVTGLFSRPSRKSDSGAIPPPLTSPSRKYRGSETISGFGTVSLFHVEASTKSSKPTPRSPYSSTHRVSLEAPSSTVANKETPPSRLPKRQGSTVGLRRQLGPRSLSTTEVSNASLLNVSVVQPVSPPSVFPVVATVPSPTRSTEPVSPLKKQGSVRSVLRIASDESMKVGASAVTPRLMPSPIRVVQHASSPQTPRSLPRTPVSARKSPSKAGHSLQVSPAVSPRPLQKPAVVVKPDNAPDRLRSTATVHRRSLSKEALKPTIRVDHSSVRNASVPPSSARGHKRGMKVDQTPKPTVVAPAKVVPVPGRKPMLSSEKARPPSADTLARNVRMEARRVAEAAAERKRREIYAKNAIMKQWVQRNMDMFHEQMLADTAGAETVIEGFGV